MSDIERIGVTRRWSDAVIHRGTAYFVEVADDPNQDVRGQIAQILAQIDARLALFGSDRTQLLQVLIYLAQQLHSACRDSECILLHARLVGRGRWRRAGASQTADECFATGVPPCSGVSPGRRV